MNDHAALIGESREMSAVRREIERVSRLDGPVLITGESGAGKDVVARAIHRLSARHLRHFVTVKCTGVPDLLLEGELFGDGNGNGQGKLKLADRGTMLLDDIDEMGLPVQDLLLRFLEQRELHGAGGYGAGVCADVRVVAATRRDLSDMLARRLFREDLFRHLSVNHVHVPPLRERLDDIPLLVEHFFDRLGDRNGNGRHAVRILPEALAALAEYSWPGNVRELRNIVERLILDHCDAIDVADLPSEVRANVQAAPHPKRERRRSVADELFWRMIREQESFWTAVYPLYMQREIARASVRDVVRKGLQKSRGNYRAVTQLFNMPASDYKRFLNFLRKQQCLLPFKDYRCEYET